MARDPLARLHRSPARGRLTLLGAITLDRLVALMTIRAFTDRAVFRAFVSEVRVHAGLVRENRTFFLKLGYAWRL